MAKMDKTIFVKKWEELEDKMNDVKFQDFDVLGWITLKEYIDKHGHFKCLIVYPAGRGKTTSINAIMEEAKSLDDATFNAFIFKDEPLLSSDEIIKTMSDERFVCIATRDMSILSKIIPNEEVYIKYYEGGYCVRQKHGTWDFGI